MSFSGGSGKSGDFSGMCSGATNISAIDCNSYMYLINGSVASVSASITLDPVLAQLMTWDMDIPIDTTFTSASDAVGVVSGPVVGNGFVSAKVGTNKVSCQCVATSLLSNTVTVQFTYKVI